MRFIYAIGASVTLAVACPTWSSAQEQIRQYDCAAVTPDAVGAIGRQPLARLVRGASRCGQKGADAIASLLKRHRASTDAETLPVLNSISWKLRDRELLNTFLQLASDPDASVRARVLALRSALHYLRNDLDFTYRKAASLGRDDACILFPDHVDGSSVPVARELSPDYKRRIAATARQIAADPTQPLPVRSAARCVLAAEALPSNKP